MNYVEGYAYAVPETIKDELISFSKKSAGYFLKHGALRVVECWGDEVPDGKITSFPLAVKKKDDEVVMFSWVEWPSKEVSTEAHKLMYDEMTEDGMEQMPFDGKRMIFGSFQIVVDES